MNPIWGLDNSPKKSPRNSFDSWLRGLALLFSTFDYRELPTPIRWGLSGQRGRFCPLLRGSSPTRGVAPKQHRGARACFHSGIFGLVLYPLILGAWVPKNLPRRRMVSAGAMLLDRLGPPGFRFNDFQAPRFAPLSPLRVREGATAAHQFPAPWLRLLTFIFCPDHTCPPLEASALALRRRRAGALHCGEFGIDAATVLSGRPS